MSRTYGSWRSPISASMVAAQGMRLGSVSIDGEDIYWLEGRPGEGGRNVLVQRTPGGRIADVVPPDFNVRTRVHEYGGGACVVSDRVAYCSNFVDQRIYRLSIGDADPTPVAITPEGPWCFADAAVDRRRGRLICVREDHSDGLAEPANTLVSIATSGPQMNAGDVIAAGYDFYSTPRLNADCTRLSWICWRHPNMPWDGTELWVADLTDDGRLTGARRVAGGPAESIYQPGWGADDALYFASDRDGWWRLYRYDGTISPVLAQPPGNAEFGRPQWVFGTSTWTMPTRDRIVCAFTAQGRWRLATIRMDRGGGRVSPLPADALALLPTALEPMDWIAATRTHAVVVAASPQEPDAVVMIALESGESQVLRTSAGQPPARDVISVPDAIEFPTSTGRTAHAFYYPPANDDYAAPPGERPPLIVIGHGGPTTATRATFDLKVQFWTSRGFAVVDVNYGGSSGYGREYRERLAGEWGVADVADMVAAASYLAAEEKADPQRLIIRGGSAGGYTALAALTFAPGCFGAAASYYGICDLEVLARDTHKFESRYLDALIGPYPATRDLYRARSPIHFVDRLSSALILFQGLEDKVVPPNQSRMMADAVRAKGLPVAYLTFPGEQHGFRRADTIVRCLDAELAFYGAVFGFDVGDAGDLGWIDNLPVHPPPSSEGD